MSKPVRKAVFPVGGMGTRFLPATKAMPKEMLPVVDKPLIQYAVEEARAAGIEEFIFVTGRGKSAIEDHFDQSYQLERLLEERNKTEELAELRAALPPPGAVAYTRQQEPLGLGHAVWCARHFIDAEPFAVLLADDLMMSETPCLKQLMAVHEEHGGNVLATMEIATENAPRYGIIDPGADDGRLVEVRGLVEKPAPEDAPSNLAVIGRYILQPEVFIYLDEARSGAGGEIQLTDSLIDLIGKAPFHALRIEGTRFDCGDKVGFLQANIAFALKRDDLRDGLTEYLKTLDLSG